MSEYWKSTPKYWCKHCKTFVRDTKLEKANHDATPKHQGSIKRFLRDLHRGHERDERDKQRAKDEVNRLNGVVSGSGAGAGVGIDAQQQGGAPWRRKPTIPAAPSRQVTPAERKSQLAQLAEMGVAVPEEFRGEMAMAGEWKVVSERPVYGFKEEEEANGEEKKKKKLEGLGIGVRKRKFGDAQEQHADEEGPESEKRGGRKVWGSTIQKYPNHSLDHQEDLDSLLGKTKLSRIPNNNNNNDNNNDGGGQDSGEKLTTTTTTTTNEGTVQPNIMTNALPLPLPLPHAQIKTEDLATDEPKSSELLKKETNKESGISMTMTMKRDPDAPPVEGGGGIVFKKRRAKPIRSK